MKARACVAWSLLVLLVLLVIPAVADSAEVYTPRPGTAERAAIMDAVRTAVAPELRKPVKFLVHKLNVQDGWAFLIATPQQPDGRPFDYTDTVYAQEIKDGLFDDGLDALLHRHDGGWTVVAVVIGATDVAWADWSEEYKAPPAIFR